MKVCFQITLAIMMLGVATAGQSDIQGKTWFRYLYEVYDGETEYNGFNIARGYFTWTHQFTSDISSRFTVDIYSSSDFPKGAGLNIKDAYLQFNNILINDLSLQAGVLKHYFGTVYDWEYVTIEKALEDAEKVASSADVGVMFAGYIPSGFGEYQLGVYNGEGYSKVDKNINKYPLYSLNLRLIPISSVTVGGSIQFTNDEKTTTDSAGVETTEKWSIMKAAGIGRFAMGPVDIWGEFLMTKVKDTKSRGFCVMPTVMIGKHIQVLGRYDMWDKDTDVEDDGHTKIIAGVNWFIGASKNTQLQVNWQRKTPEASGSKPTDMFMVQLRWEFKSNPF